MVYGFITWHEIVFALKEHLLGPKSIYKNINKFGEGCV